MDADSEEGKASDVKSGGAKEGRVSDQKPKVQWYRSSERDPSEDGDSPLTICTRALRAATSSTNQGT